MSGQKNTAPKHVFTAIEKAVFNSILKRFTDIVESKDTDGSCLRAKAYAWDKIAREYNASPHIKKQVATKQLRRLWMNLKQRTKERYRMAAEGGTSNVINPDGTQIPPALFVGIDGSIDSDMLPETSIEISQEEFAPQNTSSSHSPLNFANNTRPSLHNMPATSWLRNKQAILEQEYGDRQVRANELHKLEKLLLQEKIREVKAKADLAELMLRQHRAGKTHFHRMVDLFEVKFSFIN